MGKRKINLPYRILSAFVAFTFACNLIMPPQTSFAQLTPQTILNLPSPGSMVTLSAGFNPVLVRGITIHPDNPLRFDFIVDPGDENLAGEALTTESTKLIKYFLATLTTPEDEIWVNLSPYEKDKIIPQSFGDTQMGRDLLAQDYLLKQLTASLMYPEKELGREFWDKVYKEAYAKYGTTEIPVNTFNKVWIVPEKAVVYEHESSAFVLESRLKVMLEQDYEASRYSQLDAELENNAARDEAQRMDTGSSMLDSRVVSRIETKIIREVIIPAIEVEVNEGETFANLRQIYNSMILATWYKIRLKDSLLGQVYVNQGKTKGVDTEDKRINQKIYSQYLAAFKQGVYNYIKEDYDPSTQTVVPRKYFSGGFTSSSPILGKLRNMVTSMIIVSAIGTTLPTDVQARVSRLDNPKFKTITWESKEIGKNFDEDYLKSVADNQPSSKSQTPASSPVEDQGDESLNLEGEALVRHINTILKQHPFKFTFGFTEGKLRTDSYELSVNLVDALEPGKERRIHWKGDTVDTKDYIENKQNFRGQLSVSKNMSRDQIIEQVYHVILDRYRKIAQDLGRTGPYAYANPFIVGNLIREYIIPMGGADIQNIRKDILGLLKSPNLNVRLEAIKGLEAMGIKDDELAKQALRDLVAQEYILPQGLQSPEEEYNFNQELFQVVRAYAADVLDVLKEIQAGTLPEYQWRWRPNGAKYRDGQAGLHLIDKTGRLIAFKDDNEKTPVIYHPFLYAKATQGQSKIEEKVSLPLMKFRLSNQTDTIHPDIAQGLAREAHEKLIPFVEKIENGEGMSLSDADFDLLRQLSQTDFGEENLLRLVYAYASNIDSRFNDQIDTLLEDLRTTYPRFIDYFLSFMVDHNKSVEERIGAAWWLLGRVWDEPGMTHAPLMHTFLEQHAGSLEKADTDVLAATFFFYWWRGRTLSLATNSQKFDIKEEHYFDYYKLALQALKLKSDGRSLGEINLVPLGKDALSVQEIKAIGQTIASSHGALLKVINHNYENEFFLFMKRLMEGTDASGNRGPAASRALKNLQDILNAIPEKQLLVDTALKNLFRENPDNFYRLLKAVREGKHSIEPVGSVGPVEAFKGLVYENGQIPPMLRNSMRQYLVLGILNRYKEFQNTDFTLAELLPVVVSNFNAEGSDYKLFDESKLKETLESLRSIVKGNDSRYRYASSSVTDGGNLKDAHSQKSNDVTAGALMLKVGNLHIRNIALSGLETPRQLRINDILERLGDENIGKEELSNLATEIDAMEKEIVREEKQQKAKGAASQAPEKISSSPVSGEFPAPQWLDDNLPENFVERRRSIFGEGIEEWLRMNQRSQRTPRKTKEAVDSLLNDPDFLRAIENPASEIGIEVIKFAVSNNIYLGTRKLSNFMPELRKKLPYLKKRIKTIYLSVDSYTALLTSLADPQVQSYLNSDNFLRTVTDEDKLPDLLTEILGQGMELGTKHLGKIHSGLPVQLSARTSKSDIKYMNVSLRVFHQIRDAIKNPAIQRYLESNEFQNLSKEDKFVELVFKIHGAGLPLQNDNLGHIYSALPGRLSASIEKRHIPRVALPLRVFIQVRQAIANPRIQEYLNSKEFYEQTTREDKMGDLVDRILQEGLPLESEHLGQIYTALPARLSQYVSKKDIYGVAMPLEIFKQIRNAINNPRIQAYLESPEFEQLDKEDKLGDLVDKIILEGLPLESESLAQIYSALPSRLTADGRVRKKDIQEINLQMKIFRQIRAALADPRIQAYMNSKEFYEQTTKEDKLYRLIMRIKEENLPLENENLLQIYSALPARLGNYVIKRRARYGTTPSVQVVHLSLKDFTELRRAIRDPEVQAYLESPAYRELFAEDKLVALVKKIKSSGFRLFNENLGHIYSGLPANLTESGRVTKDDIQRIELPLRVYEQFRSAINNPAVQQYLESQDFQVLVQRGRIETLRALINFIKAAKLPLEGDNIRTLYDVLPRQLSPHVIKEHFVRPSSFGDMTGWVDYSISEIRKEVNKIVSNDAVLRDNEVIKKNVDIILKKIAEMASLREINPDAVENERLRRLATDGSFDQGIILEDQIRSKLVRDNTPARMKARGQKANFHNVTGLEKFTALVNKAEEELGYLQGVIAKAPEKDPGNIQFIHELAALKEVGIVINNILASSPVGSSSQEVGGIDLNPALLDLQIKRDGNGVPLPLLQQPIGEMNIEGFFPIIINVAPATNLPLLLGLRDNPNQDSNESVFDTSPSPMDRKEYFRVDYPEQAALN